MLQSKHYHFQIKSRDKKFVLKDVDMKVLACLYNKKFLTSQQITGLYSFFRGKILSLKNIQSKLTRFSAHGGILSKRIETKANSAHKRAFYSLKPHTIRFLQEHQYLPKNFSLKHTERLSLHAVLSREVLIRALEGLVKNGTDEYHANIVNNIDLRSFLVQKSINAKNNPYNFVPDEFITIHNRSAFIEMDMSTEGLEQVLEKIEHYISYAKQTTEKVGVFFVGVDGSFFNPIADTAAYGRLSNLLFRMRKYYNELMSIENLQIFVCSLKDSGDVIAEFLLNQTFEREHYTNVILEPLSQRQVGDSIWKYGYAEKVNGFKLSVSGGLRRIYRTDKNATKDFYFVFGHENEYCSIAQLDDLIHSRIESSGYLNLPLIIMYPKRDKPREVLLMSDYKDTYLFSLQNENLKLNEAEKLYMRTANHSNPAKREILELY